MGQQADQRRSHQQSAIPHGRDGGDPDHRIDARLVASSADHDRHHHRQSQANHPETGDAQRRPGAEQRHQHAQRGQRTQAAQQRRIVDASAQAVAEQPPHHHRRGKRREAQRRHPLGSIQNAVQEQRAPVSHAALGNERAENQQAQAEQGPRRQGEAAALARARLARVRRKQRAYEEWQAQQAECGENEEVPERRQSGQGRGAQRTDQATEAVHAMQHGHAGLAEQALDIHRLDVHRHVHPGEAHAQHVEGQRQLPPALAQAEQRKHQQHDQATADHYAAAADALDQETAQRERRERADPDAEQGLAERALVQLGLLLERRDASHQVADDQPGHGEEIDASQATLARIDFRHGGSRFPCWFLRTKKKPRTRRGSSSDARIRRWLWPPRP